MSTRIKALGVSSQQNCKQVQENSIAAKFYGKYTLSQFHETFLTEKENLKQEPQELSRQVFKGAFASIFHTADYTSEDRAKIRKIYWAFYRSAKQDDGSFSCLPLDKLEASIRQAKSNGELSTLLDLFVQEAERHPLFLISVLFKSTDTVTLKSYSHDLWKGYCHSLELAFSENDRSKINSLAGEIRDDERIDSALKTFRGKELVLAALSKFDNGLRVRGAHLKQDERQQLCHYVFSTLQEASFDVDEAGKIFAVLNYLLLEDKRYFLPSLSEVNLPFKVENLLDFIEKFGEIGSAHPNKPWFSSAEALGPQVEFYQQKIAIFFAELVLGPDEIVDLDACSLVQDLLKSRARLPFWFSASSVDELSRLYFCVGRTNDHGISVFQEDFNKAQVPTRDDLRVLIANLCVLKGPQEITKRRILVLLLSQLYGHRQPSEGICTLTAAVQFAARQRPLRLIRATLAFLFEGKGTVYEEEQELGQILLPVPQFVTDQFMDLFPKQSPQAFLENPAIRNVCESLDLDLDVKFETDPMTLQGFARRLCGRQLKLSTQERDLVLYHLLCRLDGLGGRRLCTTMALFFGQIFRNKHPSQHSQTRRNGEVRHLFLWRMGEFIWAKLQEAISTKSVKIKGTKESFMKTWAQLGSQILFFQDHAIRCSWETRVGNRAKLRILENGIWRPLTAEEIEGNLPATLEAGRIALLRNGEEFSPLQAQAGGEAFKTLLVEKFGDSKSFIKFFESIAWEEAFRHAQTEFIERYSRSELKTAITEFYPKRPGYWVATKGNAFSLILERTFGQKVESSELTETEDIGNFLKQLWRGIREVVNASSGPLKENPLNILPASIPHHAITLFTATPFLRFVHEQNLDEGTILDEVFHKPVQNMVEQKVKCLTSQRTLILKGMEKLFLSKRSELSPADLPRIKLIANAIRAKDKGAPSLRDTLDELQRIIEESQNLKGLFKEELESLILESLRHVRTSLIQTESEEAHQKFQRALKDLDIEKEHALGIIDELSKIPASENHQKDLFSIDTIAKQVEESLTMRGYQLSLQKISWTLALELGLPQRIAIWDNNWRSGQAAPKQQQILTYVQPSILYPNTLRLARDCGDQIKVYPEAKMCSALPLTIYGLRIYQNDSQGLQLFSPNRFKGPPLQVKMPAGVRYTPKK